MTQRGDTRANAALADAGLGSRVKSIFAAFSLPDSILFVYVLVMSIQVWRATPGPVQTSCARELYIHAAVLIAGCVASRLSDLPPRIAALVYRIAVAGVLLRGYLMLRDLLPLVRPDSLDQTLLAIDIRLFGGEPSLWLERFNQRPIVEWFAFFYFSYFWINLTYLLVVVFWMKPGRITSHFAIGTVLVFCVGQLGYTAVPGWGPIHHLAHVFHGPVNGGLFWGWVTKTVEAGSALKDIFPSLHTAVPTWLTCFAIVRARHDRRWRLPALVTGFFAANIIFSTVFLRWHYAIDVVAGLALGISIGVLAPRLAAFEEAWRARMGLRGCWSFERTADER